jgi:phage gpG-like protein
MAKKQLGGRATRDKVRKLRRDIPQGTATLAVGWFRESFRKQGFTDTGFKRWKKRKPNAKRNKGRAILTDTGRLKRSIRKERVTLRQTRIVSKLPYSARHNEGLDNMPQRKFMGESQKLERKMLKFIYKSIDKALGF